MNLEETGIDRNAGKSILFLIVSLGQFFPLVFNSRRVILDNEPLEATYIFLWILVFPLIALIYIELKGVEEVGMKVCKVIAIFATIMSLLSLWFMQVNPLIPPDEEFVLVFSQTWRIFTLLNGMLFGSIFALIMASLRISTALINPTLVSGNEWQVTLAKIALGTGIYMAVSHLLMNQGWLIPLVIFIPAILIIMNLNEMKINKLFFSGKKIRDVGHVRGKKPVGLRVLLGFSAVSMSVFLALALIMVTVSSSMEISMYSMYGVALNFDLISIGISAFLILLFGHFLKRVNNQRCYALIIYLVLAISSLCLGYYILVDFTRLKQSWLASIAWGILITSSIILLVNTSARVASMKKKGGRIAASYVTWMLYVLGGALGYVLSYANAHADDFIDLVFIPIGVGLIVLVLEIILALIPKRKVMMKLERAKVEN
ncbi:MAG: hypothetical protein ACFFCS_17965 [Candidatus Hodarchaeota archaeon]